MHQATYKAFQQGCHSLSLYLKVNSGPPKNFAYLGQPIQVVVVIIVVRSCSCSVSRSRYRNFAFCEYFEQKIFLKQVPLENALFTSPALW